MYLVIQTVKNSTSDIVNKNNVTAVYCFICPCSQIE